MFRYLLIQIKYKTFFLSVKYRIGLVNLVNLLMEERKLAIRAVHFIARSLIHQIFTTDEKNQDSGIQTNSCSAWYIPWVDYVQRWYIYRAIIIGPIVLHVTV